MKVYRYRETASLSAASFQPGTFIEVVEEARDVVQNYATIVDEKGIHSTTGLLELEAETITFEAERGDLWDLHEAVADLASELQGLGASVPIIDKANVREGRSKP